MTPPRLMVGPYFEQTFEKEGVEGVTRVQVQRTVGSHSLARLFFIATQAHPLCPNARSWDSSPLSRVCGTIFATRMACASDAAKSRRATGPQLCAGPRNRHLVCKRCDCHPRCANQRRWARASTPAGLRPVPTNGCCLLCFRHSTVPSVHEVGLDFVKTRIQMVAGRKTHLTARRHVDTRCNRVPTAACSTSVSVPK